MNFKYLFIQWISKIYLLNEFQKYVDCLVLIDIFLQKVHNSKSHHERCGADWTLMPLHVLQHPTSTNQFKHGFKLYANVYALYLFWLLLCGAWCARVFVPPRKSESINGKKGPQCDPQRGSSLRSFYSLNPPFVHFFFAVAAAHFFCRWALPYNVYFRRIIWFFVIFLCLIKRRTTFLASTLPRFAASMAQNIIFSWSAWRQGIPFA